MIESWVFLWTDVMVWLLLLAIVFWAKSVFSSEHNRKQWLTVFKSPVAMASAVVLVIYLAVALLDSIHFELKQTHHETTENQVEQSKFLTQLPSALDFVLLPMTQHAERTYSAPLATHEYSQSLVYEGSRLTQDYLPLKFGGQHLENKADKLGDILSKLIFALLLGLLVWLVFVGLHVWWRANASGQRCSTKLKLHLSLKESDVLPWWSAYLTLLFFVLFFSAVYYLSHYYHVFGTDKVGGDVLYQSIKSVRTGVLIGVLTTLVMLPLALFLGIAAGYFRGWVDDVIQYVYTTLNSIPGVLLIVAAVLVMQTIMDNNPEWFETTEERADMRLLFLILILGITSWTGLCRLLRAETLKISQIEYITAAKAFGVSHFKIIYRHILPNLMHIVLIAVVLDFSGLVLAEAVLSYVGVGVDPTMYSWGNMINQARLEMAREPMVWWSLFSAFVFMFILVLAANLFSDRVQYVLDPKNLK